MYIHIYVNASAKLHVHVYTCNLMCYSQCSAMDSISHSWTPEEVCKELANIEQSLEVRKTLFEVVREWSVLEKEWSECPLKTLKVEALQQKANIFIHTIDYLERS